MARCEYSVSIEGLDNGVLVQVGCKRLAFRDDEMDKVFKDIQYLFTGGYAALNNLREEYLPMEDRPEEANQCCEQATPAPEPRVGLGRVTRAANR